MAVERTLVIDIGNRFAKIFIITGDELGGRWLYNCSDPVWLDRLEEIAQRSGSNDAVLVSVIPDMTESARSALDRAGISPLIIHGEMELPIKLDYGSPKRLGADRVADAVGAWHFYGDDFDTIVSVDAGTAITVDLVKDGKFRGGAIIPGLMLMTDSLHRRTAQLPNPDKKIQPQFPGKGTEQCISAGAIAAAVGAIEFLWNRFTSKTKQKMLILTGGDSNKLAEYIKIKHTIEPLLLVKGAVAILDFTKNGA